MELVILFSILVIVAATALTWGKDSRDNIDSEEWARRRNAQYQSHHF